MNILYVIGNGLDIAHHMETSYQNFFDHYLTVPTDDNDIRAMKKDIHSRRYKTWADLEMGLGEYSFNCADKDVFLKCLSDIKEKLRKYLQKESEKINLYTINTISNFINPDQLLEPEPRERYIDYRLRFGSGESINVMTLNYTSTLESLFGYGNSAKGLSNGVVLHNILHVHGTLDNMMVMGVNDTSQISNTAFNTDIDVVEEFVKPEFNEACLNNKNTDCESLIQNANIIVLYGTSLGNSDDKWWKLIGKRMELDAYPLIVYLPYDEKKDLSAEPNHLRRWTLESIHEIHDKFNIKIDEKMLYSRICVAFNKTLLPISKLPKQSNKIDISSSINPRVIK